MDNQNENNPKPKSEKLCFFVKNWWIFPLACVICSLLVIPSLSHDYWGWVLTFVITSILLLIFQFCIFVLCLFQKKWWRAIGAGICSIGCFLVLLTTTFAVLAYAGSQPSSFGKEHPIPEGIAYNIPLKEGETIDEKMLDSVSEDSFLQIWDSFQGGIYEYSLYYPALPDGKVFLRCFEVTENINLSAGRIRMDSSAEVKDHTEFGIVVNKQRFTITEGDWGDYYAARIEVWFKNANTGEETKLLEKIYRVEGWER